MDAAAFDKCLSSAEYQTAVQKDIDESTRLGVTGTPAVFINGRLLVGAAPLENFVRVIDDELERTHQTQSLEGPSGYALLTRPTGLSLPCRARARARARSLVVLRPL